ncbi:hypothetical protein NL676_008966 [Syzygium grande]|nr:hypothetical protein NL676_008966 [Syzygium grande]
MAASDRDKQQRRRRVESSKRRRLRSVEVLSTSGMLRKSAEISQMRFALISKCPQADSFENLPKSDDAGRSSKGLRTVGGRDDSSRWCSSGETGIETVCRQQGTDIGKRRRRDGERQAAVMMSTALAQATRVRRRSSVDAAAVAHIDCQLSFSLNLTCITRVFLKIILGTLKFSFSCPYVTLFFCSRHRRPKGLFLVSNILPRIYASC